MSTFWDAATDAHPASVSRFLKLWKPIDRVSVSLSMHVAADGEKTALSSVDHL